MPKQPIGRGSAKIGTAAIATKNKLKGVKILDWHELGTPHQDVITDTVQTGVANFKANVATLTKLKELRDLNILIHGKGQHPWNVIVLDLTMPDEADSTPCMS